MSYGIEIYDENGVRTLGMADFTYSKIFETVIPAPGNDTSIYPVSVPGFNQETCVVVFTPTSYQTGSQEGYYITAGFVPVYTQLSEGVVGVLRRVQSRYYDAAGAGQWRTFYTTTSQSLMEVFKVLS